jgi:hygromycin-B 7''-O-kinase
MPSAPVTTDELAAIMRAMLPESVAVGFSRMGSGEGGGAHLVRFAGGAEPVVVKVYDVAGGWILAKEVFAYRAMRAHGIEQIPRLVGGESAADSPIGRPYLVMSALPGVAVEEFIPAATDADVAAIYRRMGAALRSIHGIEQEGFGYRLSRMQDADRRNDRFMRGVFDRRSEVYLERTGDRELTEAARQYVADRAALFALCTTPVLLHGDFHEGNVIVDDRAGTPVLSGVVDLENALAGDPVVDLARLYSFNIRGDAVKLDALFDGYGSVPPDWDARRRLYQLVHDFERWIWHDQEGRGDRLATIVVDIRGLLAGE